VLTAGKARYTQIPTTFFPQNKEQYQTLFEEFLKAETIAIPEEFVPNARKFLYAMLFLTSLPFGEYVKEDGVWNGYVTLRDFPPQALLPEQFESIRVITAGILNGSEFIRQ
jgi:hypothetical protein